MFLILVALLEILWTRYDRLLEKFEKNWKYFFLLLAIPFFSSLFWGTKLDANFFFGSLEKHHGYIFLAGVISLVLLLQTLGAKEKHLVVKASLVSGLLVSFFALLEYIGISVFYGNLSGASWGSGRSISTLGNPNYVAGYLLMLLPLVQTIRNPERYVIVSIIVMAILVTKSFIAIFLLMLYGVYLLSQKLKNRGIRFVLPIAVGVSLIVGGYLLIPADKFLSLTSRFVLMRETLSIMGNYLLSFFLGF